MSILLQIWSGFAVSILIFFGGEFSKEVARKLGLRSKPGDENTAKETWYDVSLWIQPILAGALCGIFPWPTLHMIEELTPGWVEVGTRMLYFSLWGAGCSLSYKVLKGVPSAVLAALRAKLGAAPAAPQNGGDDEGEA